MKSGGRLDGGSDGAEDGASDGASEVAVEDGYDGVDVCSDTGDEWDEGVLDGGDEVIVDADVSGARMTASQDPALYPNLINRSLSQITAIKVTPSTVTTKFFSSSTEKTPVKPSAGTILGETKYKYDLSCDVRSDLEI